MSAFEIVLLIYGAVIALTTLTVVFRMIVGPTILDRALSTDMLVVMVVMAMALYSAQAHENWAGPAMLSLTGLAFIGTVTFARFVAREDLGHTTRPRTEGEEPETTTGPLQALHLDHSGITPDPENHLHQEVGDDLADRSWSEDDGLWSDEDGTGEEETR